LIIAKQQQKPSFDMNLSEINVKNKLLTPDEVADILQIRYHKVLDLLKKGELVGIRVGKFHRIRQEDLDNYIWRRDEV
jgi:excisionase family DNA binding protein